MHSHVFHKEFKVVGPAVLPVIHAQDDDQIDRNIVVAVRAGAQGVLLINHDFDVKQFLPLIERCRQAHPLLWMGVNFLGVTGRDAFPIFGDLESVAACFPGAEITRPLDEGKFSGRVSVALGPMRLNFMGEGSLQRNEADWTGIIEGSGEDRATRSRATAILSYSLTDNLEGSTRVEVQMDYQLFGPLAQIGRPTLVEEVARQLTIEFKEKLDEVVGNKNSWQVAGNHAEREISIVRLLFRMLCKRITSFLPGSGKAKED